MDQKLNTYHMTTVILNCPLYFIETGAPFMEKSPMNGHDGKNDRV